MPSTMQLPMAARQASGSRCDLRCRDRQSQCEVQYTMLGARRPGSAGRLQRNAGASNAFFSPEPQLIDEQSHNGWRDDAADAHEGNYTWTGVQAKRGVAGERWAVGADAA